MASVKWHISSNGEPGKCTAHIKDCPLKTEDGQIPPHFSTKKEAESFLEEKHAKEQGGVFGNATKKATKKTSTPSTEIQAEVPDELRGFSALPPTTPDGRQFVAAWNEHTRPVKEWEKNHGESIGGGKTSSYRHPDYLMGDEAPSFIRPRGEYVISKEDFYREMNDSADDEEIKRLVERNELKVSDHVACYSTRQGGGNRECYCYYNEDDFDGENHAPDCMEMNNEYAQNNPLYIADKDDDFDSTYASFYFNLPAGYEKKMEEARELDHLLEMKREMKKVEKGNLSPWGVLSMSENDKKKLHLLARSERGFQREKSEAIKNHNAKINHLSNISAIADKDPDDITGEDVELMKNAAKSLSDNTVASYFKRYNYPRYLKDIEWKLESPESFKEMREKIKKAQTKFEHAQLLPDGDLKEELLGDRGTATYQVTEKRGRRNVKVTKTYERGSLLGSEADNAKKNYNKSIDRMKSWAKAASEDLKKAEQDREDAQVPSPYRAEMEKLWAKGWTGKNEDMPSPPESFFTQE